MNRPLLSLLTATLALGATKGFAEELPPLDAAGRRIAAHCVEQSERLRSEILETLPAIDPARRAAYLQARSEELAAKAAIEAARKRLGEIQTAKALVGHAKGKWIGGADKGIREAEAKLTKATTEAEREAAQAELEKWQQNREDGVRALAERQAAWDEARKELPEVEKTIAEAEKTLDEAEDATLDALEKLGLEDLLDSDVLDARLAQFVVIQEATPEGLARFASEGDAQRDRIAAMLGDPDLLVRMAVADGAKEGRYGRAMEIYDAIRAASSKSHEGTLNRLALAIALEHAVPVKQRNAVADQDAPEVVDPVARYLHYEEAFLKDELDPAFADLTVWDYRMVVDGEEPDEILAWGREMLRNYRPDHITTSDHRWRYAALVRTDIRYGSQDNHYDEDELQFFQNILKNGGVCGRRAFIGRFILRAFGVPTTARPQRGHAALVRWTPDGWVPCLGGGWGSGWTKTRYDKDLDFLATTQGRATGERFLRVKRAQWIGDVMGEPRVFGRLSAEPEFWYGVALDVQRRLIERAEALDAVGQDIAEANVSKEAIEIVRVAMDEKDRSVHIDESGAITLPAAATRKPTESRGGILFMDSVLGGKQLHYSRNGGDPEFEYALDVPTAGDYELVARVVTPSWQQNLMLTLNDAEKPVEIPLPFTVGRWETTAPVTLRLDAGENVLRFSRRSDGQAKGFSIRDFTLTPLPRG